LYDLLGDINKIGDVQLKLGDTDTGFASLSAGIGDTSPNSCTIHRSPSKCSLAMRALSVIFNKIGDVQLRLGDTEKALQAYQQAFKDFAKRWPNPTPPMSASTARFVGEL
jgi:hypothetical protein